MSEKNTVKNEKYWEARRNYPYYDIVKNLAKKYCPDAKSIIDIGSGPTLNMNKYDIKKRTILDACNWEIYEKLQPDIKIITGLFQKTKVEPHDIVLCLEVLEHNPQLGKNRKPFVDKLFKIANRLVIISLPYKWPGKNAHAGIDESTLPRWIPNRKPVEVCITQDQKYMIAVYEA